MSAKQMKIGGLPVVDAKKPLEISIGELDIPRSKAKVPGACVAANACRRALGAEARVHLSRVYIRLEGGKFWTRYATPSSLRSEIVAFDRGGRFQPGDYHLSTLPATSTAAYHRARKDQRKRHDQGKKTGQKRHKRHLTEGVRANARSEYGAKQ